MSSNLLAQRPFVEEAVSSAKVLELVSQYTRPQWPDATADNVILHQASNEKVNVVDRRVEPCQQSVFAHNDTQEVGKDEG